MEQGFRYNDEREDGRDNATGYAGSSGQIFVNDFEDDFTEDFDNDFNGSFSNDFDGFSDDFDNTDDFDDSTDEAPVIFNPNKISDSVVEISLSAEDLAAGIFAGTEELEEDEDLADFKVLEEELVSQGYRDLDDADFEVLNQLAKRQKLINTKKENASSYLNTYSEVLKTVYDNLSTSKAVLEGSISENAEYLRDNVSTEGGNPVYIAAEKIAASIIAVKKTGNNFQEPAVTADEVFQYMVKSNVSMPDTDVAALKEYLQQIIPKIAAYNKNIGKQEENNKLARRYSADVLLRKPKHLLQRMAGNLDNFSVLKNIWTDNGRYWTKCEKCGKETELHSAPVMLVFFASARANTAGNSERYFLHLPVQCECGALMILTSSEYKEIDNAVIENYKLPNAATSRSSVLASAMQQVTQLCSGAACLVIEPPVAGLSAAVPFLIREYQGAGSDNMPAVQEQPAISMVKFDSVEFLEAVARFKDRLKTFGKRTSDSLAVDGSPVVSGSNAESNFSSFTDVWEKRALPDSTLAAIILNALSKSYEEEKSKALLSFIYRVQENPVLSDCLDYAEIIDLEQTLLLLNGLTEKSIPYLEPDRKANLAALCVHMDTVYGLGFDYSKTEEERILRLINNSVYLEKSLASRNSKRKAALKFIDFYKEAFGYWKIINVSSVKAGDFDRYICDDEIWKLADAISDKMLINNYAGEYYEVWKSYRVLDSGYLDDLLRKKTGKAGILSSIEYRLGKFFKTCGVNYKVLRNLSVTVAPVNDLHAAVRKCCVQVQNLNYYRFLKCARELPEELEYVIPNDLALEYESARKRLLLLAAEEISGKKEYEYYLRGFSPEELGEYSDELELFTFGRWILKRHKDENITSYVTRLMQAEEGQYDYAHSDDYLEKFMCISEDVLVLIAVAAFSGIEYQSYSTSVFIGWAIQFINGTGNRKVLQQFLNVSDSILNVVESSTIFADGNNLELSLCKDFYRILSGNYFTSAGSVVSAYSRKADAGMLSIYDGIGTKPSKRKAELLSLMAGEIEALAEQPAESNVSGYEEMMEEVIEKVNGKTAKKILGV